jgi:serine/threonine protein kinase
VVSFDGRKDDCRKEYEILDTIGAGSFAQVKVGRRKDDNTKRAIKIISKSALNSDDVEGLRSEVDILELVCALSLLLSCR